MVTYKDQSVLLRESAAFQSQTYKSKGPPKPAKEASAADELNRIAQNDLLRNVLEALDHPIYVIDARDYTVKWANAAANFGPLSEDSFCYASPNARRLSRS